MNNPYDNTIPKAVQNKMDSTDKIATQALRETKKNRDNLFIWGTIIIIIIILLIFAYFIFFGHHNNKFIHSTKLQIVPLESGLTAGSYTFSMIEDSTFVNLNTQEYSGIQSVTINNPGVSGRGYVYVFKNTTTSTINLTAGTNVVFAASNIKSTNTQNLNLVTNPTLPANSVPIGGGCLVRFILYQTNEGNVIATLLQL